MDASRFGVAGAALGGHQSHFAWHLQHSRKVRGSPATIECYGRRLFLRGRCSTWRASISFRVAGAALGASQCHFAWTPAAFVWQVQHLEDLNVILHGRCSTRTTSRRHLEDISVILSGRCGTWSISVSFCVAGAALGGPDWVLWMASAFAWQVQHLEDLSLILRGKRSTRSISVSFCVAGAALGAIAQRSLEVRHLLLPGRCSTWKTSVSFCVAGAALGAPQCHFAWQVQHSEHLSVTLRGRCNTRRTSREVHGSPATIEYCRLLLRGRCSIRTQPMGPKTSFTHSPYTAQHSEL